MRVVKESVLDRSFFLDFSKIDAESAYYLIFEFCNHTTKSRVMYRNIMLEIYFENQRIFFRILIRIQG